MQAITDQQVADDRPEEAKREQAEAADRQAKQLAAGKRLTVAALDAARRKEPEAWESLARAAVDFAGVAEPTPKGFSVTAPPDAGVEHAEAVLRHTAILYGKTTRPGDVNAGHRAEAWRRVQAGAIDFERQTSYRPPNLL